MSWLFSLACASPAPPEPASPRVVAMGDLHGDLDNAIAALRLARLVDEGGHWTGGAATLVQTGDTTDRGPDSKAVLGWLRQLSAEAAAAGGRVVPLLGNHEVMNLRGDWRYVAPGDVAAYGGEEARRAALAPAGEDGAWLRTLGATAKVGETVFAHGGIRASVAGRGIDAINAEVRRAIDEPGEPEILGHDGPLWYRGYVNDAEEAACAELEQALGALDAERMVVGHTTRDDGRVQARCGGRLLVIDIGISDHYGSHLGVVELRGGTDAWVLYPSGPADLPDP